MKIKLFYVLLSCAILVTPDCYAQGFLKKLSNAVSSVSKTVSKVTGNTTNGKESSSSNTSSKSQSSNSSKITRFRDIFDSKIENAYQTDGPYAFVEIALTNKTNTPLIDRDRDMVFIPGQPRTVKVTVHNPDKNTKVSDKLHINLYRFQLPGYFSKYGESVYYNEQGVSFDATVEQKPDQENLVWCNRKDIAVSDCYIHSINNQPYFHCKLKNLRNNPIKFTSRSASKINAYDEEGSSYSDSGALESYINYCKAFPNSIDDYFGSVNLDPGSTMDYDVRIAYTTNFSKGEYTYLCLDFLDDYLIYCTNLKYKR